MISTSQSSLSKVLQITKLNILVNRLQEPWFAYLTIFLLQLKIIWGMWLFRDLTFGDTSSYFTDAFGWFNKFTDNIVWSPLYTTFYGSLLHLTQDVYSVTILHRMIIVLLLCVMVLALMRRLLPSFIAWLVAVWWVILPINFDSLYEVHLFALIPILSVWLLILWKPTLMGRGVTLSLLLGTCILVRNEYAITFVLFAIICFVYEIAYRRKASDIKNLKWRKYLLAYLAPLVVAILLVIFFFSRSTVQFSRLSEVSGIKHTLNMCQVYAFGYQQRHPEWNKSPWTDCSQLMETTFGKKMPSLVEMLTANPQATIEHFSWNFSLTPNGLQVLLFNATSGNVNPDYAPVEYNSNIALILSIGLIIILLTGFVLFLKNRVYWWQNWIKSRIWGWMLMGSVGVVTFFIIPTQRPRPSYLFSLGLIIMALFGMAIFIIFNRWSNSLKQYSWSIPVIMVIGLIIAPVYYSDQNHVHPRLLLDDYRRLVPYTALIEKPDTVFLKGEFASDISNYIGKGYSSAFDYSILDEIKPNTALPDFLASKNINLFYLDSNILQKLKTNPLYKSFLEFPQNFGWKEIGYQNTLSYEWLLLQRVSTKPNNQLKAPEAVSQFPADLANPNLEYSGMYEDGWASEAVFFRLAQPTSTAKLVIKGMIPLIDNQSFTSNIEILSDGVTVATKQLTLGDFEIQVPITGTVTNHRIDLRFSQYQNLPGNDGRPVTALLKYVGYEK
ncbi:MAG: hypothetical protein HXX08_11745 [Chloroflexi bacterium]|uniref:Uncharacterized protein n=1 Tax=Candidatus Chlorohelix allophototropha TaxID=3003348 RepID=A0A8T7LZL1_9CHLR|nr:hypothetical protein [Chloroflexota bacterium]WJW65912.1 hypothetical protein OZ401_001692 [Chloroflexota bacterium L227-S17]